MADNPNRFKGGNLHLRAPGPRAHRDFLIALAATRGGWAHGGSVVHGVSVRPYQLIDRDARRILRKLGGGERERGRPPTAISPSVARRDALRLLRQCQQTGFPPPESLVDLIGFCLNVSETGDETKPNLTDDQWTALKVEARRFRPDREPPKWPSTARPETVASKAGVTPRTIHSWRKDPEYRKGLLFLLVEQAAEAVLAKLDEVDQRDAPDSRPPAMSDSNRLKHLAAHIHVQWTGSVQSIIDGKIYSTVEDYAQHLLDQGVGLADEALPIVKQK